MTGGELEEGFSQQKFQGDFDERHSFGGLETKEQQETPTRCPTLKKPKSEFKLGTQSQDLKYKSRKKKSPGFL